MCSSLSTASGTRRKNEPRPLIRDERPKSFLFTDASFWGRGVLSPKKREAKNPGCHDERLIVENAPTLMATVDAKPKRSRAAGVAF